MINGSYGVAKVPGTEPSKEIKVLKKAQVVNKEFTIYGDFENPLFLAKDVAEVIEVDNVSDLMTRVDDDEKVLMNTIGLTDTIQTGNPNKWFLTENGLYEVLMQSRKPIAKEFKQGVKTILKEIRRNGSYYSSPKDYVAALRALADAEEEKQRLALENAKMKPLVEYAEDVLTSNDCMTSTEMAKELGFKSGKAFNQWCAENNILFCQGGRWLPYSKYSGIGWFATRTATYPKKDGTSGVSLYTVITELGRKGLTELYKKLMNKIELL